MVEQNKRILLKSKIKYEQYNAGTYNINIIPGNYQITIQSGSSGGGGGSGFSDDNSDFGANGVKGSDSVIKYGDISYVVSAPNAGIGSQYSKKNGGDANTCVNSSFVTAGKGGAGAAGAGVGAGAGGDGGYCTKDININLISSETATITIGNSGNGGKGGDAYISTSLTMDGSTVTAIGGLGGTSSDINGKPGILKISSNNYKAYSGGGGGSGPNGKVIITPVD